MWTKRGFGDSCAATIKSDLAAAGVTEIRSYSSLAAEDRLPPWLFDSALQRSHQSALVRKDPEHYQRFFPDVPPDLDYVWPVRSPAVLEREQRKADSAKRRNERAGQKAAGVNAPDLAAVGAGDDLK
jgi:hypothetical protein